VLRQFLATAAPSKEQADDIDFLLNAVEDDVVDQIFDFMVRDFSRFALQLYSKTGSTDEQMALCLQMIRKPVKDTGRFERVWQQHVAVLDGAYAMND
jgi:acyl-CoA dehydrogenase